MRWTSAVAMALIGATAAFNSAAFAHGDPTQNWNTSGWFEIRASAQLASPVHNQNYCDFVTYTSASDHFIRLTNNDLNNPHTLSYRFEMNLKHGEAVIQRVRNLNWPNELNWAAHAGEVKTIPASLSKTVGIAPG